MLAKCKDMADTCRMLANDVYDLFGGQRPSRVAPKNVKKGQLGQYFTPDSIANFMANMFPEPTAQVHLLDAGAGEGALTRAFAVRHGNSHPITAETYELDGDVIPTLSATLAELAKQGVDGQLAGRDFLSAAAQMILLNRGQRYTHAILNPPYRKISSHSRERQFAASVGLETVNLYSAFVGLALELMRPGGQLVAIIPRSFCNGPYYKPFRTWIFERAALQQIHLFGSRRDAFSGDGVLQENVILRLERGGSQNDVVVSTSSDASFADYSQQARPFADIVQPQDPEGFINVPMGSETEASEFNLALADLGVAVSTGPVVGFRLREHLRPALTGEDVPLLFPQHLKNGEVIWPIEGKKPNAICVNAATRKWLMPRGWYVIVKRFSSKEERRRIVATLCDPSLFPGEMLGFENKTNVLHNRRGPLPELLARGLTIYLNSSPVDRAFRLFSGHTQVNATDLRQMKFPSHAELEAIGRRSVGHALATQMDIDAILEGFVYGAHQAGE